MRKIIIDTWLKTSLIAQWEIFWKMRIDYLVFLTCFVPLRKAVEGLVRVDSQEVQVIVDREVAKQETVHQQFIREYQDK